jgi:hypothetical protein
MASINEIYSGQRGKNRSLGSQRDLGSLENGFGRRAEGFKPPADIHLGVGFPAEMPGGFGIGSSQIPLDDGKLLVSALDHEPMDRMVTDDAANLALEFFQTRHAFSLER